MIVGSDSILLLWRVGMGKRKNDSNVGFVTAAFCFVLDGLAVGVIHVCFVSLGYITCFGCRELKFGLTLNLDGSTE